MLMMRIKMSDVIARSFLVICLLVCSVSKGHSQFLPPTFLVSRDWKIPEDEPVGSNVATATPTSESAHLNITFSIESSLHSEDVTKFFRIDEKSGKIYLNQSMQGKKGQVYMLYVIATNSNGGPSAKIEVRIRVGDDPRQSHPKTNPKFSFTLPNGAITPPPPPYIGNDTPPLPVETPRPQTPSTPSKKNGTSKESPSSSATSSPSVPEPKTNSDTTTSTATTTTTTTKNTKVTPKAINNVSPGTGSSETGQEKSEEDNYPDINDNKVWKQNPGAVKNPNGTTDNLNNKPNSGGDSSSSNDSQTMTLVTIIPIVVIFAIVPIIAASTYLLKKRNKMKKRPTKDRKESAAPTNSSVTMSGEGESPSALTQWVGKRAQSNRYESWAPDAVSLQAVNRWEFPRHHLQIGGILGEGCFGQVWRCEALNIDGKEGVTTVAVKTLKESAGERERADLLSELAVMKMLDPHPNVVRLLGACTEKDPIFVVMEFVAMGKLQSYLRNSRAQHYYGNLHADSSSLSSKDLTSFAHQVARGMEYLASKGIIHRDLAARNVLIDKERLCKVADFGFARDVVANHVYERKSDGRLPIRWMAPEALYDNIFTTKTDVWSFGVLMWEIVTLGSTPYPGMAAGEVMRKVRDGYRLEKPEHCRRELYNIMFYCWAHNPDERPTFSDLVNFLRHLLFSETDYIELDRFPDHDYYNMSSLSGEKL